MDRLKYCDDVCSHWHGECDKGKEPRFRMPRSYQEVHDHNWGWTVPKECKQELPKHRHYNIGELMGVGGDGI